MNQRINIVLASSSKYIKYACVMLTSLFETNKCKIRIYFYYNESIEAEIDKLKRLAEKYHNEFIPMYVSEECVNSLQECGTWHASTWYRWMSIEDLSEECERVLLLGIDIIIRRSILEFYNQDMEEKIIAAVQDPTNMYEWYCLHDECKARGKDIREYVNADVVLLDLKKAKPIINLEKMLKLYSHDKVYCMDQGILNHYFSSYIKVIEDYTYNLGVNVAYDVMDEESYETVVRNAHILHFAGEKPWNDYNGSFAHQLWQEYAKKTMEYDSIQEDIINSLVKRKKEERELKEKWEKNFNILNRLWNSIESGILVKKIDALQLNSIAIYGAGHLGRHLQNCLQNNGIRTKFFLDVVEGGSISGVPRYTVKQLHILKKVDAIIVTPVYAFNEIKKMLSESVACKIISLEEIIE
uniref:glycosyltransferase family 8 protein n=1 Tax=Agathobacter sp. TaxID=2021311 RepID=UPI004057A3B7